MVRNFNKFMKNQTRIEDSVQPLKRVHVCLTTALALGLALSVPLRSRADDENSEWSKVLAGVSSSKPSSNGHAEESKTSSKKTAKPVAPKKASKEAAPKKDKPS